MRFREEGEESRPTAKTEQLICTGLRGLTEEMEVKHVSNQSHIEGCLEALLVIDVPLTIIRNRF